MADFFEFKDGTIQSEVTDPESTDNLLIQRAIMDFQEASNSITRALAETSAELAHRLDVYYNSRNAVILAYAAARRGDAKGAADYLEGIIDLYE